MDTCGRIYGKREVESFEQDNVSTEYFTASQEKPLLSIFCNEYSSGRGEARNVIENLTNTALYWKTLFHIPTAVLQKLYKDFNLLRN